MDPEKRYSMKELAGIWEVSVDSVRRLIMNGDLEALEFPQHSPVRNRVYKMRRIADSERLRFEREHTTHRRIRGRR
jgi:hypothetical protein